MANDESVTHWLQGLKAGDPAAATPLWARYFGDLVARVRARLAGTPTAAADGEDAALSAFDSFCRGAAGGRFPRLDDRDDLWQVLFMIADRKAANWAKHERRQKRGGGRVVHASAGGSLDAAASPDAADPAFAAAVADECRALLDALGDPTLRAVAVAKMQGYENAEIAAQLGRSVSSVERKLRLIRKTWTSEAGDGPGAGSGEAPDSEDR